MVASVIRSVIPEDIILELPQYLSKDDLVSFSMTSKAVRISAIQAVAARNYIGNVNLIDSCGGINSFFRLPQVVDKDYNKIYKRMVRDGTFIARAIYFDPTAKNFTHHFIAAIVHNPRKPDIGELLTWDTKSYLTKVFTSDFSAFSDGENCSIQLCEYLQKIVTGKPFGRRFSSRQAAEEDMKIPMALGLSVELKSAIKRM